MRGNYNNGYDEYEDEEGYEYGEEREEGYEEEEEREGGGGGEERERVVNPKEQEDFLKLREKLKQMVREKLKKERASSTLGRSSSSSLHQENRSKFGSFFGPSQPVIAQRVIEESRSIKDTQHLTTRDPGSSTKGVVSASKQKSPHEQKLQNQRPKFVSEKKEKIEKLKDMRDYSFLFSDDADLPTNDQPSTKSISKNVSGNISRNISIQRSENGRAPGQRQPLSNNKPKPLPARGQNSARLTPANGGPYKPTNSNSMQQRQLPSKQTSRPPPVNNNKQRPVTGSTSTAARNGPHHAVSSSGSKAQAPPSANSKVQRVVSSNNRMTAPPVKSTASASGNGMIVKRNPGPPVISRLNSKHNLNLEQRRAAAGQGEVNRVKPVSKQLPSHSKSQTSSRQISRESQNQVVKKRPIARRDVYEDQKDDEDEYAIGMIRKMFRYDPGRWAGRDEDDSDMEVGFDVIQREERRSSKIGKKEDEEQLRLIEEEERRERMRKKQKMSR